MKYHMTLVLSLYCLIYSVSASAQLMRTAKKIILNEDYSHSLIRPLVINKGVVEYEFDAVSDPNTICKGYKFDKASRVVLQAPLKQAKEAIAAASIDNDIKNIKVGLAFQLIESVMCRTSGIKNHRSRN